jgi:murein DD-endopeptidase MepM/ murein hydrolase activator NlpD
MNGFLSRFAVAAALLLACAAAAPAFRLEGDLLQGGLVRGTAPAGTLALTLDGNPVPLAEDGRFVIGFDRDAPSNARLVARVADGREVAQLLEISPRSWRIEHVNVPRRPGPATEDYLRRRRSELARIAAARAVDGGAQGWRQRFVWPARGRISGVFGAQRVYRGEPAAYHSGIDVAARPGALVVAPADGVVVLAGPPEFSLEGNLVILDHGHGLNSAFLHLASSRVAVGQKVRQGEPIGTVGATGRATGPHLHWGVKWREARIDPAQLAGPQDARARP